MGHVVRKEGLEKLMHEGKTNGKRQRERRILNYMEGLASAIKIIMISSTSFTFSTNCLHCISNIHNNTFAIISVALLHQC